MPVTIDYTTIDFDAIKAELINYLKETKTFKDVDFAGSNIRNFVDLEAYLGSLFGYYINAIANEPFLPSAKRYKNLNRIARLLSYNPRGDKSAELNIVGQLLPEFCYGKENVYFEIPAYSSFPSNKPTPDGINFTFTNPQQVVYSVKSFGVRTVEQNDFSYSGFSLPVTKPTSFWTAGTTATPSFDPSLISLDLSDTLPLSVLDRLDPSNYKKFDIKNVPLFDSADPTSVGQPFNRSITMNKGSLRIVPETTYFVLFTYDKQTSSPYLELLEEGVKLDERRDDIITSIRLDKEDADGTFYTLKEIQNNAKDRFYVGVLGMQNLDSVNFEFDKLESTKNSIKQVHLFINKAGDKPPFTVLVDGIEYSFKTGKISSQIFELNAWDPNQPFYNVNLNIITPNAPDFNYDATLTVESKSPGINSVTIAKIYPNFVDPATGIKAINKDSGQRFGNIQAIPKSVAETSDQRSGSVSFTDGVTSIFVPFDNKFEKTSPTEVVDYILELTPSENVQLWFSNKSEDGFTINVEQNVSFDGTVDWIASRVNSEETRQQVLVFDNAIPPINGSDFDYTIFLTASDNVKVWYTDKTKNGFTLNTEKSFAGTVSYSTFVFTDTNEVVAEKSTATQRKGSVTFSSGVVTKDIEFDGEFEDNNYGLHMIANKNVNVWYTNKTTKGFTINVEANEDGQIVVNWFADFSAEYVYQKHGMINFSGQITSAGTVPGIRFNDIPETFLLDNLKQGLIKFSYINRNGTIETANNNLLLEFATDRKSINEIKVNVTANMISYADIRVFVKNSGDEWEEWDNATNLATSTDVKLDSKVFFVRVNEYKNIEISFGDGITFGKDPYGSDIYIFGLSTVGKDGNIPPNTISKSVILSKNILGDDNITVQFEQQFIQLLGLKNNIFFSSNSATSPTSIYDSEGTLVSDVELTIKQPTPAFGGSFIETTEELRSNAGSANLRQDRVVSKDDYRSFCNQAFSDYIIKTQVLSYKDIKESGFLPQGDLEKFWFNTIFIVALPKIGNEIQKKQRDYIIKTLDENFKSMASVEHQLFSGQLTPVDILIRYKKTKVGGSKDTIETTIRNNLRTYFDRNNREMGEVLEYGPIIKTILNIPYVETAEVSLNKDPGNKFNPDDYNINAETQLNETVEDVKRRKVLELLAKDPSLMKVVNPLFDIKNTSTSERKWVFSQNIEFGKFELPIIGDIIIESEP